MNLSYVLLFLGFTLSLFGIIVLIDRFEKSAPESKDTSQTTELPKLEEFPGMLGLVEMLERDLYHCSPKTTSAVFYGSGDNAWPSKLPETKWDTDHTLGWDSIDDKMIEKKKKAPKSKKKTKKQTKK